MKVQICYKNETRLDDEILENVEDINIYDDDVEITFNNSKSQYEKNIRVTKLIPKELLNSFGTYDF